MAMKLPSRTRLVSAAALLCAATPSAAAAECDVSGSAATAADVVLARAACDTARARFARLFGETAPIALIVLHDRAGYEVASAGEVGIVYWPNSSALAADSSDPASDARSAAHWRDVLPHEVMHALTMAHYYRDGGATGHRGYGTPLPDWFEEGVAIWGEPPESRRMRIEQARRLPAELQALPRILDGEHPVAGNNALMAPVPGARLPPDNALRAFYPQSIAVVAFVHDSGGSAAMRELGRRLAADPADRNALVALPGMPANIAAVIDAWHAWLARTDF